MCARKFVEGSAQQTKVYKAGPPRRCVKTRVVRYKCGCEVTFGGYDGRKDASMTCDKHHKPIEEIVTREHFSDP